MQVEAFKKSAGFIVQRNVSERVARVLASFNAEKGRLKLVYCVEGEATDDDWEDIELACGELIAEFPEIVHAETDCCSVSQCQEDGNYVVYTKS